MSYAVGSLVQVRGREWVVLPESKDDLLILRPLGGLDEEVTGILPSLEEIRPANFGLPNPEDVGDHRSCRLLRDAVRLSTRASAGPFRSFGRIAFSPRPYQLVPLLMALKLNPVRMLIADDVGVGKTIEALIVARELLDRGEIQRTAILCPPHLAEQWQGELASKFQIEAELVLSSTARQLERRCRVGQSLFDLYPHVVVSMDFVKSDRRRDEFVNKCPEMVIVDEAHTCAYGYEGRGGRHQRHQMVKSLCVSPSRHMIFVTATPHSGKEEPFRALLGFLDPSYATLPFDLTGPANESHRKKLARHFVQRRRADIRHFMQTETPFPKRLEREDTYKLSEDYHKLIEKVLKYTQEIVREATGGKFQQRVRWWGALALLRSVASSPAAAIATLRKRTATQDAATLEEVDEIGRKTVLDLGVEDQTEGVDLVPGTDTSDDSEESQSEHKANRQRLLAMARDAEKLMGKSDVKLAQVTKVVKGLLNEGFSPIVFCRFIPTADYVAETLQSSLGKDVEVISITGLLPPGDREERVSALSFHPKRVLVATDCLSEGINLQEWFDAVIHYDLSWSPTRHEQREGRVDRYGQPSDEVRVITYYGLDNPIDGIVLEALLRKHKKIRSSLGISVPVPVDSDAVLEAIFEGLLMREKPGPKQMSLFDELTAPMASKKAELEAQWEDAAEKEKRSRTVFAQETIKAEEVALELAIVEKAIGSGKNLEEFVKESLQSLGAVVSPKDKHVEFHLSETPRALRDAMGVMEKLEARFDRTGSHGVIQLTRTHPIAEGLANFVMDTALDSKVTGIAKRAGAIRTRAVSQRTILFLVRYRYDIITARGRATSSQLVEECLLMAFSGSGDSIKWLTEDECVALLEIRPDENIVPEQASFFVQRVVDGFDSFSPHLEEEGRKRAGFLLDSHKRVREAAKITGLAYKVEPKFPPDVLGIYVYLPPADVGGAS